jgi:hypothetical protein
VGSVPPTKDITCACSQLAPESSKVTLCAALCCAVLCCAVLCCAVPATVCLPASAAGRSCRLNCLETSLPCLVPITPSRHPTTPSHAAPCMQSKRVAIPADFWRFLQRTWGAACAERRAKQEKRARKAAGGGGGGGGVWDVTEEQAAHQEQQQGGSWWLAAACCLLLLPSLSCLPLPAADCTEVSATRSCAVCQLSLVSATAHRHSSTLLSVLFHCRRCRTLSSSRSHNRSDRSRPRLT